MWRITLFLLLGSITVAQATIPTIDPDEATQHLTKRITPTYPQLAEVARIQGNAILEIHIDESGNPKSISVVRGHPMLLQAAIDAVKKARYKPFEVNGKPSEVRTFVFVTFGSPYPANDIADHAEILTLLGKSSLSAGDLVKAEQNLNKASELLPALKRGQSLDSEEWQATMGRVYMAEKKYSEAENNLKLALDLAQKREPDSADVAEKLRWLAQLYVLENKYELARTYGEQEIKICERYFSNSGEKPEIKQSFGSEIAYRSWVLTVLALQQNDHSEAAKHCHTVLDFQSYLGASYRDQAIAGCQKELNLPAK